MVVKDALTALNITAEQITDNLLEGVIITSPTGTIEFVNAAFSDVTGYSLSEAVGRNPRFLQSGKNSPSFYSTMWEHIKETGHWQGEICNRKKNGELYTEWLTITTIQDEHGRIAHYLGVFSDISKKKRAEEAVWYKAHHDSLTGLPNRAQFSSHCEQGLALARRNRSLLAVSFLDLDHLKSVNDRLGHLAGDRLLQEVAKRMQATIREVDIVARLGGDEFALLLPDIKSRRDAVLIAEKLLAALRAPFDLDGQRVKTTASIGISVYPEDGIDVTSLIGLADAAMYEAKRHGRDQYRLTEKRVPA